MSTHEPKLSSIDDDWDPESGKRRSLPHPPAPFPGENRPELTGFSGTCENTSLSDWIQLVQMSRREAVIGIDRPDGKKASFWCRDGDIIDASCEGATGEDAVYRALTWEGGKVSVAFTSFERVRRIPLTTPALLLRAAVYLKDSNMREIEPDHVPSSPATGAFRQPTGSWAADALPADSPTSAPAAPRDRADPLFAPVASADSPNSPREVTNSPESPGLSQAANSSEFPNLVQSTNSLQPFNSLQSSNSPRASNSPRPSSSPPSARSAAPEAPPKPVKPRRERRLPRRAWVTGLVLGASTLIGMAASRLTTPEDQASTERPSRQLTTRLEASRPELPLIRPSAPSPVREESPSPPLEKAAARPPRNSGRTVGKPPPRRVVAAPMTKAPPLVEPKALGSAKPELKTVQERAPRIRIIEERESKIEVIQ